MGLFSFILNILDPYPNYSDFIEEERTKTGFLKIKGYGGCKFQLTSEAFVSTTDKAIGNNSPNYNIYTCSCGKRANIAKWQVKDYVIEEEKIKYFI